MSILNSCSNWLYSSASGIKDYAITIGKSKEFRRVGLQCGVLTTSTATFSVTKEPSLKVTMGGVSRLKLRVAFSCRAEFYRSPKLKGI